MTEHTRSSATRRWKLWLNAVLSSFLASTILSATNCGEGLFDVAAATECRQTPACGSSADPASPAHECHDKQRPSIDWLFSRSRYVLAARSRMSKAALVAYRHQRATPPVPQALNVAPDLTTASHSRYPIAPLHNSTICIRSSRRMPPDRLAAVGRVIPLPTGQLSHALPEVM